jgi:hypothetical protein
VAEPAGPPGQEATRDRPAEGGRTPAPGPARGALAQAVAQEFSFSGSIGGPWGLAEAVVPITVFSAVYGVTRELRTSLLAALVPAVLFSVRRLVLRQPITQAVSGLLGLGLGAFLAMRSGRAEDVFLPSIWKNSAYGAVYALSSVVRWPLVGVVLGPVLGEWMHWRQVPARRRAYHLVTWLWVAMFAVRLVVQVPLYLAGKVAVLGAVNVPLGLPLFGIVVWLSWLVLRRVPVAHPPHDEEPVTEPAG